MPYIIIVVVLLVIVNFYMLYKRRKYSQNVGKRATADRIRTVRKQNELIRRLDSEQEEAEKYVELRNKTLEMYEQVRRESAASEEKQLETEHQETHDD